jgi:hypothetical protein
MELLRYIIVFLVVGWGGGLLGGLLFLITLPLLSRLRGTTTGRVMSAAANGLATLVAVVLAFHACRWTGDEPSYGMFAVALVAMISNNCWRIRRALSARTIGCQALDEEPTMRAGVVTTERMNSVADLLGFACGLAVIPTLAIL